MERGRYKDVEYISMDAIDCLMFYLKDPKNPVVVPRSLIIRSMTTGHTTISVSDDEIIMFQFKVTDDVRRFLIEALKEV